MDDAIVKFYKNLAIIKSDDFNKILKAISSAQRFIIRHKLMIVGGQAIDFALKFKGLPGIYVDEPLIDLDTVSDRYFELAYKFAEILREEGFTGISVINALHPTTMRVRVDFIAVLDITYIPTNILETIPSLHYKNYKFVHPHYQIIDQHSALSYPYRNSPYEVILYRYKKDMSRYDLLYEYFPIRILGLSPTITKDQLYIKLSSHELPIELLDNQCINGIVALNYWHDVAKRLGFKSNINIGSSGNLHRHEISSGDILEYTTPIDYSDISVYSDYVKELYDYVISNRNNTGIDDHDIQNVKFYEPFLDKVPEHVHIGKYRLYNNTQMIAAHKIKLANLNKDGKNIHIYVANIQSIMFYLSLHYILIMKSRGTKRSQSFYLGYLLCRELITWASEVYLLHKNLEENNTITQFFPTADVYGNNNVSDYYAVAMYNFRVKNKEPFIEKNKYAQPRNVYDRDLLYGRIRKAYRDFDMSTSKLYKISGLEQKSFL